MLQLSEVIFDQIRKICHPLPHASSAVESGLSPGGARDTRMLSSYSAALRDFLFPNASVELTLISYYYFTN